MLNSRNCAAEAKWTWLSLNPGTTKLPLRSMTRVFGPRSFSAALLDPTTTNLPSFIATAWAVGFFSSTVQIDAVVKNQIGW